MGQVTVFSGPERRRRWSEEQRVQILAEAFSPGACVADVARRHDVSTALIYSWRNKLRQSVAEPGFAEAVVVAGDRAERTIAPPAIIVELGRGSRVSIFASAPAALAAAALKALR
ncbi:MAG: transposase [Hyphomicrobium aestuarii]|nr:transposase [Hyphomicrobium aestuarii]